MTLVPFMFKQFSTGEERPDADRILKKLLAASDNKVKIISNQLQQKGINVSKIIEPVLNLDPANKRANKEILDQARQQLSDAIYNSPKLQGKDALGANAEGIVINMPSGQLVKVTSPQMKSAMAAKLATPGAKRQGPAKTAVVAVGSFVGHKGHQELFNYTINKAKQLGGDPYLFMGNAVGKDDPIPVADKIKTWQQLYPQYSNNISATIEGGSLMQKIKHELINPMPGKSPKYDNIVIMVGEDQANMPIAGALMKAVNKFPGYEHVKAQLEVTPRGTGMSFTQLRNSLKTGDEQTAFNMWNDAFNGGNFGAQKLPADWIKHLMDISRKGMGVVQQPAAAPQTVPQPVPVAEQRLFNALVRTQKAPVFENSPTSQMVRDLINPQGREAQKYAKFDSNREQRRAKMEKGALADRNSRKYSSEKDDWGDLKKEEFNGEYDDEAGMAQSNLRTMARAVDGLLKTIKNNDNLPEWGQEKIAKAEMMLVSVWDYLQSQKERGIDPKVNESRALAGLKQIVAELSSEKLGQYKKAAGAQASAADKAGNTKKADKRFSGIVKATKKQFANDEKGVAEATGDEKFDTMMKKVAKTPTQAQRNAERIRQKREREEDTRKHFANGGGFGPSPADKLSIRKGVAEGSYTTEKQLLTRIRQIMYDRKLSGTDSNAGELNRLKQQLKDMRSQQGVAEGHQSSKTTEQIKFWYKDAADAVEMAKAAEALNVNGMYDEAIKKYKHQAQISLSKANSLKQGVAEADMNRRGFLKGLGAAALGGAGVGAAQAGIGADLAGAAAKGLYYGTTSRVAGSTIHKEKNAADMAFADKIPDEWDRTRYLKAVKSVIRSRDDSVMRYAGHDGSASRGSIIVAERKFNRIKTELSQKYNIPLDPVKEQGVAEDWQKANKQDKTDGMSKKAVSAYRRENPGSKLKTAVTTKPSKLKAGSKDANRRKSFCARMSGNKGPMKDEKGKPTPKAKALSRWNCESVEEMQNLIKIAEQKIAKMKEGQSTTIDKTAKDLINPPKIMQHRAKRDQVRDQQYKGSQIAKRDRTSKDQWGNLKDSLAELSSELLGNYKKAAGADAKKADAAGNFKRGDKRFKGINKATTKQFDNDAKKTK
jgi:hypothetical protein